MSAPSKKTAPPVTESLGGAASLGAQVQSPVKPVRIWAAIGGAILAFQLYVWIRWITGPNFERVPTGPSDPPMFMKAILMTWTGVIVVGLPASLYYFIISLGGVSGESRLTACSWWPAACCSSRIRC